MSNRTFICYRRDDDPGFAGRIYDQLSAHFGSNDIFMDVQGITPGENFIEAITAQIEKADIVLVIIGQRWLIRDDRGLRIFNDHDQVRFEIEQAILMKKRIIPILVNKAKMPKFDEMPKSINCLSYLNAIAISHDRFLTDVKYIISNLEEKRDIKSQSKTQKSKTPIFLGIASYTEEWQDELNYYIIQALQSSNFTSTIFAPGRSYATQEGDYLMSDIISTAENYGGGILIIPTYSDEAIQNIVEFAESFRKPLVCADRAPPTGIKLPENLCFVSVSDVAGGRLAAEAILDLSRQQSVERILVIAGLTKHDRHKTFSATVRSYLPSSQITVSEDGEFNRIVSSQVAERLLLEAIGIGKPFDAIFSTANSMTLGCLDAISNINSKRKFHIPKIIGYDGVQATKRIITSGNSPLIRLVVQDAAEVARTLSSTAASNGFSPKNRRYYLGYTVSIPKFTQGS